MSKQPTKRPRTWESIYYAAIRRGDDPAYALYLADRWQERKGKQREATMPDNIRTPHGALSGAQLDARDALARGETPPPAALQGLLWAAADLRHAAGAALDAPDDHRARGRLRAAVGAYDRARAEWGGERPGRSPDVS